MKKILTLLSLLLIVQILLVGAVLFSSPDLAGAPPDTPLINLGERPADRLIIEGAGKEKVVLQREKENWILPEHFRFPVEKNKVEALLGQLRDLQHGFPIASTQAALARFAVAEDNFERRITLFNGDEELEKIYFGSSPGIRRVHARAGEDEAVYAVTFSLHQAPAVAEDWENKAILTFSQEEIQAIRVGNLTIRRDTTAPVKEEASAKEKAGEGPAAETEITTDKWRSEGLTAVESLDQDAVTQLAGRLSALRIAKVSGLAEQAEYGLETPELRISFTRGKSSLEGEEDKTQDIEYILGRSGMGFVLKTSNRPEYFRLHEYMVDPLIEAANRDKLVKREEIATPVLDEESASENE